MSRRSRIVGIGSAALLVAAGAVCTAVMSAIGSDLALGLMGVGAVVAISLVFLEAGFRGSGAGARGGGAPARRATSRGWPAAGGRPAAGARPPRPDAGAAKALALDPQSPAKPASLA